MHRLRPIVSAFADLFHYWPGAATLAVAWTLLEHAAGIYIELLSTSAPLLYLAIGMLFLNTLVGIYTSLRRGEGFQSEKLGKFFGKVAKYAVTMLVFILIANGSEEVALIGTVFSTLDDFGLFIIAFREGSSVIENTHDKTLDEVIKGTWSRMNEITDLPEEADMEEADADN